MVGDEFLSVGPESSPAGRERLSVVPERLPVGRERSSVGPEQRSRDDRLALAYEIADRAKAIHGDRLTAIGIYGSTARGTDGPFSDLEMLCVLRTPGEDYTYEWCVGPWKAEVNFRGEDVALRDAAAVDERWSLTHGSYMDIRSLFDPEGFFRRVRQAVQSPGREAFDRAIAATIVGELYEWIGKLRNAMASGKTLHVSELALDLAKYGALIIGLSNRHLYTSGSTVFEEVLTLPDRPAGYDDLYTMVTGGRLSDVARVAEACERFWSGVVAWAESRRIQFVETRRIPF